ncbi:N-alpha-acetyltransferase 11 [Eumeta japonica]|uniref:N-terminal amino-acid N(alpha)-acetyltransferase NatA n=1 Tax=Eumeta variegata TaxID=151549 RepID=A0A4C1TY39_EUMVA|nr:N-alpha-acetyltransferase 11 [Eumeta japonica]
MGVLLVRPPSVVSGAKLTKSEAKETKQIASLRIHVERCVTAWLCSFEPRSVVSGSARVRVCGVPRSVSRAAAVKPRASVPARSSGYPAVCTPSPHTISAPRVGTLFGSVAYPSSVLFESSWGACQKPLQFQRQSNRIKYARYVLAKMEEDGEDNRHGHITSLAVKRSHRRLGLAQKLMNQASLAMVECFQVETIVIDVVITEKNSLEHLCRNVALSNLEQLMYRYYAVAHRVAGHPIAPALAI